MTRQLLLFTPIIAGIWLLVLTGMLRPHRTDLRPDQSFSEGSSWVWQVNVYNPRNYDVAGRKLLRWVLVAHVFLIASLLGLLYAQV